MKKVLPLLVLAAAMLAVALSLSRERASAAGPCGTSHDANDGEETQFLSLLQQWRNQNLPNSTQLSVSGALNAAAAWFAEWQVNAGAPGGHLDNLGRNWAMRARDCGYDAYYSNGTGEGTYAVAGSGRLNIGPTEAVAGITYPGSGAAMYVPNQQSYPPVKCAGVAVKRNASGTVVAWVVVLGQYPANQPCPGSTATGGGGGGSPSPSTSPSPTATFTPTPSPTATPVPQANYGMTVTINAGWNLVYLPAGGLADILDTVRQCFNAVYKPSGTGWLRYVPGAPAYVSNVQQSLGEVFWIAGTANCGTVGI